MNTGLDWERQLEELNHKHDHILGASSLPCIASIPEKDRIKYLPKGEVQKGREDFMDCASRAPINIAETKFNFLYQTPLMSEDNAEWLRAKGYVTPGGHIEFSDRYIAIKSKTTRRGNSLKAPCHAMHTWGLIPKKLLPAKKTMSWANYHDPSTITLEMDILAAQFRNRFPNYYELVTSDQFLSQDEMLDVAGFAWPQPKNGVYPRVTNEPNHAFAFFAGSYDIFDNYEEGRDDFVKRLAPDFRLMEYGYRIRFEEQRVVADRGWLDIVIELLVRGKTAEAISFINKGFGAWIGSFV